MRKTPLGKAPKEISCKTCGTSCKSGKGGLCNACYAIKARAKREAAKKAKKSLDRKLGNVSEDKLWKTFADLVKMYYPLICHGHEVPIKLEKGSSNTQACHFVRRDKMPTKYDIRNVLPGCATCNGFDQSHVYRLGTWIDKYWGQGTAGKIRMLSQHTVNLSQSDKNELYKFFKDCLSEGPDNNTVEGRLAGLQKVLVGYLEIMRRIEPSINFDLND
jgi:hypothetical protein